MIPLGTPHLAGALPVAASFLVGVASSVVGSLILKAPDRPPRTVRTPQKESFWRVRPLLKLAQVDMSASVRTTARVPHEYVAGGSAYSRAWNWTRRLMLRASSPKTGFVILGWQRIPSADDSTAPGAVPRNGFRLSAELHPHDSREHFQRSLTPFRHGDPRVLAIATPEQASWPMRDVRCFLVKTEKSAVAWADAPHGTTVVLESADPLLSPDGNEWTCRRGQVPLDALWLICEPAALPGTDQPAEPAPLESPGVLRKRRRRLWMWPSRYLGAVAVTAAFATAAYFVVVWTDRAADEQLHATLGFIAALAVVVAYYSFVVVATLQLTLLACHAMAYIGREHRREEPLRLGTTECINDADLIRNGQTSD